MPKGAITAVLRTLVSGSVVLAVGMGFSLPSHAQDAAGVSALANLSLEQLGNVEITSVSKTTQPLSDAAAAVYVITHDDIIRSGATSIPEILRLAPNLQVAQMSANTYAITARGFNGNSADKLLVLIDGRSVYTPLFGGVQWDEQDVLPENIERVEVISGPGATLWGANAVNGVINIITKKSGDTQGGLVDLGWGNREKRASLQYGGKLQDDLAYRVYLEGFSIPQDKTSTGANAQDGWSKAQGGFRLDWTPQNDQVMLEGNVYSGAEDATPTLNTHISGQNLQINWQHLLENGSSLQLLAYYNGTRRYAGAEGGYALNTYDVELQHSFSLGAHNDIVWGAGDRIYQDQFTLNGNIQFLPGTRTENLANVFAQDTITLSSSLKLTAGVKLEDDPFSGLAALPSARLAWKASDDLLFWAAASHAIRAPTRFDVDLNDTLVPGVLVLTGDRNFQSEKVRAYEVGSRVQATSALSFSASAFFNHYDDLRSVEITQETTLPFLWTWGNMLEGHVYGLETWAAYSPTDWWQLKAGFNIQHESLRFKPGSSELGGVSQVGDDPHHQASLQSTINLSDDVSWNADLRWIGRLPDPRIPAYVELTTRLAWKISDKLELVVSGFNLLHAHHLEYEDAGATIGDEVDRSFFVETKWRF